MMKLRFMLIAVASISIMIVLAVAVMAQEEPPSPYAGLKNPFSWDDASAQENGKNIYQRSCMGCHGANGGNIADADFSKTDSPESLEQRADYYFWVLSEGMLSAGMPPFKSSLSEEQRWQVLTYLWSLGKEPPPPATPPTTKPPAEEIEGILVLAAPQQGQTGKSLTMTATVQDKGARPISNATVKFFAEVNFFTSGLMEIGDALTDSQGVAVFEYTPRLTGEIGVLARYGGLEDTAKLVLTGDGEIFYHPEVGIKLPNSGEEPFIGPESALNLGEDQSAPMTAFRLPGGMFSWLLIAVAVLIYLWSTYFRVIYQLFRISKVSGTEETDVRIIPQLGMLFVLVVGIVLVLMLTTGPYSHLHLPR